LRVDSIWITVGHFVYLVIIKLLSGKKCQKVVHGELLL
jgi:hypothetical protein